MKAIPILRCSDMKQALAFYTGVLGFRLKYENEGPEDFVVDLIQGECEIQLTSLEGNQVKGIAVNIRVAEVDEIYAMLIKRGFQPPNRPESPVHQAPINQTWGLREFYVTDMDGNTLRYCSQVV